VHRFVAQEIVQHIEQIEQRIARMDQYLLQGLQPWQPQLRLLQTLPGIDEQGAAMLLVEIGADMSVFGSAERLASPGWASAQATTRALASARTGRIRKGNAWVQKAAVRVRPGSSTNAAAHLKARFDVADHPQRATRSQWWRWPTRCCAPSTPCSASGKRTTRTRSVDYEALNVASATRRAGSKC
jgi:transposase